jgi:ribosomal protein S18 acetylase RimI-like enzyme
VIRPATAADVDAVLELWEQARSPAAQTPDDAEVVNTLMEHDSGALIVSEEDGRIVGAVIAGWDGWRGNIYRLAVLPDRRRRGTASMLVAAAHEHLYNQGCRRVTALVGKDEADIQQLWRSLGYDYDAGIDRWVRNI